jgi:hypothetical protein
MERGWEMERATGSATGTVPLIIRIEGVLDLGAASHAIRQLRSAGGEREVILEFGAGAQCDLVALSLLADEITHQGSPVSVRGLSGHDVRILEYLGVPLPRRSVTDPLD